MELRQLRAFATLAAELHFGRAAEALHMGQPSLSEAIRRLERELGTPLFVRTTRRVALTSAGEELLARTKVILDEVAGAVAAVRRVADGETGVVRIGITPPVAPVWVPHLQAQVAAAIPGVDLDVRQLWLAALSAAVASGDVDVALTVGVVPAAGGLVSELVCGEPLLVGLRATDPLARRASVALDELAGAVLGVPDPGLFPAWALAQRQALDAAGVDPPTVRLRATDVAGAGWTEQHDVSWVLLTGSLAASHRDTVLRPLDPPRLAPYTLQWNAEQARSAAVVRFVHLARTCPLPDGWVTLPGHLHHGD